MSSWSRDSASGGEAFSGTDKRNIEVIIKKKPYDSAKSQAFGCEINIWRDLGHPNLVTYYDSFLVGERIWVRKQSIYSQMMMVMMTMRMMMRRLLLTRM